MYLKCMLFWFCFGYISASTHKYSTPVGKIQTSSGKATPPPAPTNIYKKYVDFDLNSQSSRYSKEDPYHYGHKSSEHYYPYFEHSPYMYEKGSGFGTMIPYVIGTVGLLLLPLLTLLLTLAVNIAPATNIPTTVTTATGKFLNSTNLVGEIWDKLESAILKYGRLKDM